MLYLITLLFLILIEIYLMLFYNRKVTNKLTLELPNTSGRMYYNRLPNSNDTNLLVYLSGGPTLGYRDYVDQTIFNLSKNGVDMPWFVYKNATEFPIFAINEIEQYVRYLAKEFPQCKITFVSFCFGSIIATHIASNVKDLVQVNKIIAIDSPNSILECLEAFKNYWFRFDIYIIKSVQTVFFKRYPELTKKFSKYSYLKGYDFLIELTKEFVNDEDEVKRLSKLNLDLSPWMTLTFIHSIYDPITNYRDNINFINNNLTNIKFKVKHLFNNYSHHCNGMFLYDNSIQLYHQILF